MSEKEILIRKAAIEEFRQHGYDGARLERIAQKAGVRPTLIHYYFRGKKNLYETVKDALDTSIPWEIFQEALNAPRPLAQRIEHFYQTFGTWITPARQNTLQTVEVLLTPSFVEQLQQAQSLGLLKPLAPPTIVYLLWSLAWIPQVTQRPHAEWENFYRQEAPALFWQLLR